MHLGATLLPALVALVLAPALSASIVFWGAIGLIVGWRSLAWVLGRRHTLGAPSPLWPLRRALFRPGMSVLVRTGGEIQYARYVEPRQPNNHAVQLVTGSQHGPIICAPESDLYPLPAFKRHASEVVDEA